MAIQLQDFDFMKSSYQRPNQSWQCGLKPDGSPCQIGPDAKGHCQGSCECSPIERDGRWYCTRSVLAGGPCETGPLPEGGCTQQVKKCIPVRSWRSRIKVTTKWFVVFAMGILLVSLSGPLRSAFINPGPLTFQHSGLESCGSCHSTYEKGPLNWLQAAFMESSEMVDSKKCTDCHDLGIAGTFPHSQPPASMSSPQQPTAIATGSEPWILNISDMIADQKDHRGIQLPCITCHKEHQGQSESITEVSDLRCTSCHENRFDSLDNGHPEFTNYPFDRRSRIAFDHNSHFKTHFQKADQKENAPAGCNECHKPDVSKRVMLTKGFEDTCAACHAGQIEGAGRASDKGIDVFGVPGLDVLTLAEAEVSIGTWPEDADDELTPFMNFLLSSDPDFIKAKQQLVDLDLLDLEDAEPEQLQAVQTYAWAIKKMFAELASEGIPTLKKRLQAAIGHDIAMTSLAKLSGLISIDAVRSSTTIWFPNLQQEIDLLNNGEAVPIPDDEDLEDDNEASEEEDEEEGEEDHDDGEVWAAAGGWYRDEFSLQYRPTGHQDLMISEWMNLTQNPRQAVDAEAANAVFETLADPKAPGRCIKCHSIESGTQGTAVQNKVQWTGARPVLHQNTFTTFSHTAHLRLLDEKEGCLGCHSLKTGDVDFASGYKDRDSQSFNSNFAMIKRETCAACHTETAAGASCTTCHDYHIGVFPPAMNSAPKVMTKEVKSKKEVIPAHKGQPLSPG